MANRQGSDSYSPCASTGALVWSQLAHIIIKISSLTAIVNNYAFLKAALITAVLIK